MDDNYFDEVLEPPIIKPRSKLNIATVGNDEIVTTVFVKEDPDQAVELFGEDNATLFFSGAFPDTIFSATTHRNNIDNIEIVNGAGEIETIYTEQLRSVPLTPVNGVDLASVNDVEIAEVALPYVTADGFVFVDFCIHTNSLNASIILHTS
jgi:hypothetical protein